MDISIIVPVYNVEKYVLRCLDSIFSQVFSGKFELIAVDDGSSDGSLQILKQYQKNEKRLVIIEHGENKNLSIARSTGIKASIGKYIMHVDSDDWLLPGAFEELYNNCIQNDLDLLVFNYIYEDSCGNRTFNKSIRDNRITTDKLEVQKYFFGTAVNKIVQRNLVVEMIYGQIGINNSEDLLYSTEILLRAKKIGLVSQFYYVYFGNSNSLTRLINRKAILLSQIQVLHQLQLIFASNEPDLLLLEKTLDYFEGLLHRLIAGILFYEKDRIEDPLSIIDAFSFVDRNSSARNSRLSAAISSKLFCLLQRSFNLSFL